MSEHLPFAGTLKTWSPRGYGLIQHDNDHRDVFLHISTLKLARLIGLEIGARVMFDVTQDSFNRLRATKIARVK